MIDLFKFVTEAILSIAKVLRLRRPGTVFLVLRKQENGMLKFVLVLPPIGAPDVVVRKLSVQIGSSTEPVALELDPSASETDLLEGEEGQEVIGSLTDVDDAGNSSEPRDFSFVLADTLAPPQPGEIGLVVREEV